MVKQSDLNLKRYQIIEANYEKFEKIVTAEKQKHIISLFDNVGTELAKVNALLIRYWASMPRHILEILVIGSLLIIFLFKNTENFDITTKYTRSFWTRCD